MALTIHTEEDDQRQLLMTIEVPEERVETEMRKMARRLAREYHFPGFRRGRAPYQVVVRRIGRDALRADVIEEMAQLVVEQAIGELEADIYAPPTLDDISMEPLVFKLRVPLSPQVELGPYREMRKEIEPPVVSDEAVEEALEQVRIRHQIIEEVDRPAEAGDIVVISGKGELLADDTSVVSEEGEEGAEPQETSVESAEADEDEIIFDEESIDLLLDSEKLFPGTPFVENLLGTAAGDVKQFTFVFPEEFEDEDLAGREATFDITVLNVKSRDLPELDEDLAKEEGNFETVEELREATRRNLEEQAEERAKNELIETMIDDLLEDAELVYPPTAVELEIDSFIDGFKERISRSGWEWEDYLRLQPKSEEQIREDFRERAQENVRRRLVLRQFVLEEKITVEEDDVDAAVERRTGAFADNEELRESMDSYFRTGHGFDMISSEILMEKVHRRVTEILSGNAPDLETLQIEGAEEEE